MPEREPPTVRLHKPVDRALREGHPWVYRDAVEPLPDAGTEVRVADTRGRFVGRGLCDDGPIGVRIFTLRDESIGTTMFASRISSACAWRDVCVPAETDAYRLLHGEGDRMPGFVCDVYGAVAVVRADGAASAAWLSSFVDALRPALDARGVGTLLARTARRHPRPDADDPSSRHTRATVDVVYGQAPDDIVIVRERGVRLPVDLFRGQKTGLFLDQRTSRHRVRQRSEGKRVLNLYAYTGGFSIAAAIGGASHVHSVDLAAPAIALAEETFRANDVDPAAHEFTVGDAMDVLAALRGRRARYDLVIADPPSFAPSEEAVPRALQAYRALHAACVGVLVPGGMYLAGSCSSHVDSARFRETLASAASSATRPVQIVDAWGAPEDHPRLPAFPEGDYLKLVLCRVP